MADASKVAILIYPHLHRNVREVNELIYVRRDRHLIGDRFGGAIQVCVSREVPGRAAVEALRPLLSALDRSM